MESFNFQHSVLTGYLSHHPFEQHAVDEACKRYDGMSLSMFQRDLLEKRGLL